nr:putative glucose-6-phosphate isomerase subunit [uncultured bacterium]
MAQIKLDISRVFDTVTPGSMQQMEAETRQAQQRLYNRDGAGNDFLGWLDLPASVTDSTLNQMDEVAASIHEKLRDTGGDRYRRLLPGGTRRP